LIVVQVGKVLRFCVKCAYNVRPFNDGGDYLPVRGFAQ
jgi:hypothetical protein